jgi:hypothetical protein
MSRLIVIVKTLCLIVFMTPLSCTSPQTDGDGHEIVKQATEKAEVVGKLTAMSTFAEHDVAEFEVRTKKEERYTLYYRRDKIVMKRSHSSPNVYLLLDADDKLFAHAVVNKETSPRLHLDLTTSAQRKRLEVALEVRSLPDGTMLVHAFDIKSGFFEFYTITAKAIRLMPAEEYRAEFVKFEATLAAWGSLSNSLQGNTDEQSDQTDEDEE